MSNSAHTFYWSTLYTFIKHSLLGKTVQVISDGEDWRCTECTWLNTAQFKTCGICNKPPKATPQPIATWDTFLSFHGISIITSTQGDIRTKWLSGGKKCSTSKIVAESRNGDVNYWNQDQIWLTDYSTTLVDLDSSLRKSFFFHCHFAVTKCKHNSWKGWVI